MACDEILFGVHTGDVQYCPDMPDNAFVGVSYNIPNGPKNVKVSIGPYESLPIALNGGPNTRFFTVSLPKYTDAAFRVSVWEQNNGIYQECNYQNGVTYKVMGLTVFKRIAQAVGAADGNPWMPKVFETSVQDQFLVEGPVIPTPAAYITLVAFETSLGAPIKPVEAITVFPNDEGAWNATLAIPRTAGLGYDIHVLWYDKDHTRVRKCTLLLP